MWLRAAIIIIGTIAVAGASDNPMTKVVSSAYFIPVRDVYTYESSVQRTYNFSLPKEIQSINFYDTIHHNSCVFDKVDNRTKRHHCHATYLLKKFFFNSWFDNVKLGTLSRSDHFRDKRQIGTALAGLAGFLLYPSIAKFTSRLFGTDDYIKKKIEQNKHNIVEDHLAITEMQQGLNGFSSKLKGIFGSMDQWHDIVEKDFRLILELIVAQSEADLMHDVVNACQAKLIPFKLFNSTEFLKELNVVEELISPNGYTLAIPSERFSDYFKIPLVDCMLSEHNLYVTINFPVVTVNTHYKLFEIFRTKFAFANQTCELYPLEATHVAVDGEKTVLIDDRLREHCRIREHGICLIPSNWVESSDSLHCVNGILNGKSVTELSSSCSYRCSTNSALTINQVDPKTLIVTNANKIKLTCNNSSYEYELPTIGAVEVKLACNCHGEADGKPLKPAFPCVKDKLFENHQIYHTLPEMWTKLEHAVYVFDGMKFTKHDQILDENWASRISVLNFTSKTLSDNTYSDFDNYTPGFLFTIAASSYVFLDIIFKLWVCFFVKRRA